MNQEHLIEAIVIIAHQMLYDARFCGSTEGRRLTELLWQLTGKSQSKPITPTTRAGELVTRTVSLPIDLDNAVSVAVEQAGISRDTLIGSALAALIAEQRLA
jgi:hypothetical protein